jgi:eukaryotic-like serine/threonine-protein kinase
VAANAAENGAMPTWSPDGKGLVFTGSEAGGKLWMLRLDGDRKPVPYLDGLLLQPTFSPDGRWMANVSAESGTHEVYVQSVPAGRSKWQISKSGGTQPVWRQDGKELFYRSSGNRIVAVAVKIGATFEAGAPKELFSVSTTGLIYVRHHYSVSPDGQRFLVNQRVDDSPQTVLLQNWLPAAR